MTAGWFLTYHEIPSCVQRWLAGLGVRDPERGARDLADLTRRAGPERLELVARIAVQLDAVLPAAPTPAWRSPTWNGSSPPCRGSSATLDELGGQPADDRDPAPGLQHQPVLQRGPDPRPRAARLAPRGAERRDRSALIDELWDDASPACRPRTSRSWPCAGSASARASGSATTTSSAASRWR